MNFSCKPPRLLQTPPFTRFFKNAHPRTDSNSAPPSYLALKSMHAFTHVHTHAHARTHTRTHTHTHARTNTHKIIIQYYLGPGQGPDPPPVTIFFFFFGPPFFTFLLPLSSLLPCFLPHVKILIRSKVMPTFANTWPALIYRLAC